MKAPKFSPCMQCALPYEAALNFKSQHKGIGTENPEEPMRILIAPSILPEIGSYLESYNADEYTDETAVSFCSNDLYRVIGICEYKDQLIFQDYTHIIQCQ